MKSQWDCFLVNLGEWQGSFTTFSAPGELVSDTPSVLKLERLADDQTVRLTLQRQGQADLVLAITSVGGNLQFFETGAFSQASLQYAPQTQFGGELALVHQERRMRIVQLYDRQSQLASITLIREQRPHSQQPERPPLTVDELLGEWQGDAITLYPDLRSPETYPTHLQIRREGDRLFQQLTFGAGAAAYTIQSSAAIVGNRLLFNSGNGSIQVLLLPDGASANCPLNIPARQPFFLEAGWLMEPNLRQRLIRHYNSRGESASLTLVTERRVRD